MSATGVLGALLAACRGRLTRPSDVARLHERLLGRRARSDELAVLVGRDPLGVAAELAESPEHRQQMRLAEPADVVRLYREILGREPEDGAVVALRVGQPVLDVALEFLRSDELRARIRSATVGDVEALYRRILDREPEDSPAVESRVGSSVLDVALELAHSAEGRRRLWLDQDELQHLSKRILGGPLDDTWADELTDVLRTHRVNPTALVDELLRMRAQAGGESARGEAQPDGTSCPGQRLLNAADYTPVPQFGELITLVVPTVDSETWIRPVVEFYESIGMRPLYAVDGRTCDATRQVLTAMGQTWIEVRAAEPRVEALLPVITHRVSTPWVLRLDDDELPAADLLRFCGEAVERATVDAWGFPRLCLRWEPSHGRLEYSQFVALGAHADMDRQWRLFKPASVRWVDTLHTPGFDAVRRAPARAGEYILHFDWVLRTLERRRQKSAQYAAQTTAARVHRHNGLYELIPEAWHRFEPLAVPRFADFARRIHQACR